MKTRFDKIVYFTNRHGEALANVVRWPVRAAQDMLGTDIDCVYLLAREEVVVRAIATVANALLTCCYLFFLRCRFFALRSGRRAQYVTQGVQLQTQKWVDRCFS